MMRVLDDISLHMDFAAIDSGVPNTWILTGGRNSGKTARVKAWLQAVEAEGLKVSGVYSEKVMLDASLIGYDLVELPARERHPLIRLQPFERSRSIGQFSFDQDGFDRLNKALIQQPTCDVAVLDEIGIAEMEHEAGLFPSLVHFVSLRVPLVLAVRDSQVDSVRTFLKHGLMCRKQYSSI